MDDIATFPWDELIAYVRDRQVIPVVGGGMRVTAEETLSQWLARHVGERLRVEPLPGEGLRHLAGRYVGDRGRKKDIYLRLAEVLTQSPPPIPPAVRQLAEITDVPLYIGLGPDGTLLDAVRAARGDVAVEAFKPGWKVKPDLPAPLESLARPIVYHLLGRSSSSADHVTTDEDLLEFLNALHGETQQPENLFDALRGSHLLFVGVDLPDWALRLMLRLARGESLSRRRDCSEYLVTDHDAEGLVDFLGQFSEDTTVVRADPDAFVAELHRRWLEGRPPAATDAEISGTLADARACENKVFISYAREDQAAVEKLAQRLASGGIETWFDRERLESGDLYAHKIREAIQRCDAFIPVVSNNTEARIEAFFRLEWRWACERRQRQHHSRKFIFPVVIDDVDPYRGKVEEEFKAANWEAAPGGNVGDAFVGSLKELVRDLRRGGR